MHWAGCVSESLSHVFKSLRYFFPLYAAVFTLPGQTPPCRRRNRPHQCRGDVKDAGMDVTRTKPQGQKKDGGSTADSGVKLPKIVNRWLAIAGKWLFILTTKYITLYHESFVPRNIVLLHYTHYMHTLKWSFINVYIERSCIKSGW